MFLDKVLFSLSLSFRKFFPSLKSGPKQKCPFMNRVLFFCFEWKMQLFLWVDFFMILLFHTRGFVLTLTVMLWLDFLFGNISIIILLLLRFANVFFFWWKCFFMGLLWNEKVEQLFFLYLFLFGKLIWLLKKFAFWFCLK